MPFDSVLPEPLQRIGFLNVDFPNYTMEELTEILVQLVTKRKFSLDEELSEVKLQSHVSEASSRGDASGEKNLVLMQRLLDEAIQRQTERVWTTNTVSLQGLTTLSEADFRDSFTLSREERIRASLAKLDNVIGLKGVKNFVHSLYAQLKTEMERREAGLGAAGSASTLHMVFSGNPGTGKTTVARIVAELLTSMGLLRKGHLVEADRAALVAGYSGQTALKTRQVVEQAMGGVLFVDEAYALVSDDGKDAFGHEALDTLIKLIEDRRQDLVVILAGYPEEMNRLIASNPGVRSRFPVQVTFEDYSEEELMQIAEKMLLDDVLILSHSATQALQKVLQRLIRTGGGGRENGNGRAVRNLLESAKRKMAVRLQGEDGQEHGKLSHSELCTLEAPDFG
jgi:SpoVK/Ycf46/Vps4 family AAA+-type ATPase